MTCLVSVIIPCYNSGSFLEEAVTSVLASSFQEFEIIVVDDGSTDPQTIQILESDTWPKQVRIFHQENGGPSSARNFGVAQSKGEFLLFLDSDNRIHSDYLSKSIEAIRKESSIGLVYSKPNFFGGNQSMESRFEVKAFSLDALLEGNFIDMCSLVRKKAFVEVGEFDESADLTFGEDGELWIRIASKGWKFEFLNEVLFDYRIREESLMGTVNQEKRERMLRYMGAKHGYLIHQRYRQYYRVMEKIQEKPFSYFLRILYYKYILRKPIIK